MNLVGKILTVFIFVMSLVFMSFAVMVYATHKNWRAEIERPQSEAGPDKKLGLMHQLKNERDRYDELKRAKDKMEAKLTAEKDAKVQALKKLDNVYALLKQEHDQLRKDYDDIDLERRNALDRMKLSEDRLAALRKQIEGDEDEGGQDPGLRKEIRLAQKQRDAYEVEAVRLTDTLHQAVNELKRLRDYQRTLRQDLDKAVAVLRKFGYKPEPALYVDTPPVGLDGRVLAVTGDGHVEINLGEDEGLLKGHELRVYRPTGYVGRIEVLRTESDRSVCQIVYQLSRVQKDDLIASQLLR